MRLNEYTRLGERVYTEQLANGLTVFVIPKPGFSKSYAYFATNYGGVDRRFKYGGKWIDTPAGVAHFLEHKMFDTRDGGNALTDLSQNGASPNAYTSSDITAYHFECTDSFHDNLRLLLSFVSVPYFTDESVQKEQGIIGQEIKMVEDNPYSSNYYELMKALFKHNPIKDGVIGTVESISEITADTLYSCHEVFYNPSNMALCVIGDRDSESIISLAKEILPPSAGEVPARDYGKVENETPAKVRRERKMEVGMPMFLMGAKVARAEAGKPLLKQKLIAELALEMLLGRSSQIYSDLYADGLINAGFAAEFDTSASVAYTILGGESPEPDKVFDIISKTAVSELDKILSPELFERTKKALLGAKLRELNSFDSVCYNVVNGYFNSFDYFTTAELLSEVTSDEIAAFITDAFAPEKLAVSVILPK